MFHTSVRYPPGNVSMGTPRCYSICNLSSIKKQSFITIPMWQVIRYLQHFSKWLCHHEVSQPNSGIHSASQTQSSPILPWFLVKCGLYILPFRDHSKVRGGKGFPLSFDAMKITLNYESLLPSPIWDDIDGYLRKLTIVLTKRKILNSFHVFWKVILREWEVRGNRMTLQILFKAEIVFYHLRYRNDTWYRK